MQKKIIDITMLIRFLKENMEPYRHPFHGNSYRAAVVLVDGTQLPCVLFKDRQTAVELALKRIAEEQEGRGIVYANRPKDYGYREAVELLAFSGNRINSTDIAEVAKSEYAVPVKYLQQIKGETAMGWTAFVASFNNGKKLNLGTFWDDAFFSKPEDIDFDEMDGIVVNSYISKAGEIIYHSGFPKEEEVTTIYRERPYFDCYVDGLIPG